ncbi:sulfite exporter TauE/SafE family protein [Solimonas sp. K1W22B-7]|uniref:sulfite exporter TauE/SafE family protein n=1 Tax=Solimonas sp. K1W22B-7 TaxID=2303331 RepID=UPI000E335955|nr:TSUP family transporter [Solimonas sp. K1W22B-7]AXQ27629.1 sulfite exporter TauE/SafE family protein [Solimonas sp. K1W22B-7]
MLEYLPDLTPQLAALCAFALLAGFIDSVVGGGGLILVPALFVLMPGVPPATLLGTNKLCSIWGTSAAAWQYLRRVPVELRATLPACAAAFGCSLLGARAVSLAPPEQLRPLVLVLLLAVLAYTLWKKDLGALHAPRLSGGPEMLAAVAVGAGIGFYDGFFGPGTGSFLLFAFVGLFGYSFLAASASAKLVNVVTNAAAVIWFARSGHILYDVALAMAVFNVAGALLGARLAIRHGSGFVRALYIAVVAALILKFGWDLLSS